MKKSEAQKALENLKKYTGADLKVTGVKGQMLTVDGTIPVEVLETLLDRVKNSGSRDNFFKGILSGELSESEIRRYADKLGIDDDSRRSVFLIEQGSASLSIEVIRQIFSEEDQNDILLINDDTIALIRTITGKKESEQLKHDAEKIISTINTELMEKARVAYGRSAGSLAALRESYTEARTAMEVAAIFYDEMSVASFAELGIGRLIRELPFSLCELFLEEVCGEKKRFRLSEDELQMINKFFEESLNISETARDLYLHRNTLVYHLEKLEKKTGLDIRNFDDALTLKIALMVGQYLDYIETHPGSRRD
ncbi:MAG: helix-turn-helix domain-containing protein [Lachnospiraceae bacterium]|nr:helix-turn-helix domain-containing protein [Lachnospiraceae bacterium]